VLVAINTATYAPSAAALDARSDDEGDAPEHRRGGATTQTRARSDPRPARVCDRAPAPPAPGGLAGLCFASYARDLYGPPADVAVFMATSTKRGADPDPGCSGGLQHALRAATRTEPPGRAILERPRLDRG